MRPIASLLMAFMLTTPLVLGQDAGASGQALEPPEEAEARRPVEQEVLGGLGPGARGVDALSFELPGREAGARPLLLAAFVPREGGPYPLVLFSHGLGMNEGVYRELARAWASHGYVVLLPRHDDRDPPQGWERLTPLPPRIDYLPNSASRASDLRRALDGLDAMVAAQPRLEGRVDAERVAVAGHSFGSVGAQLLGGAESRAEGLGALADERVDALVLFAAFGEGCAGFDADSWASLEIPLLAITGSEDPGPLGKEPVARLEPALGAPTGRARAFVLSGADHFVYLGTRGRSSPRLSADRRANARILREERRRAMMRAKPGSAWTPGEMHFAALSTLSRAFLDATLKNEEAAAEWLDSESPARSFPEVVQRITTRPPASE